MKDAKQTLAALEAELATLHQSIMNYSGDTQSEDFRIKTERYRELEEQINNLKPLI